VRKATKALSVSLAAFAVLIGLTAAACPQEQSNPLQTPVAEPLRLAVDAGAPSGTEALAVAIGPVLAVQVTAVDAAARPHLTISLRPPAADDAQSTTAVAYRYWVPVAPFWSRLEGLAWSDLWASLTGSSAAPAGASTLYLPLELREELERAVGAPLPPPDAVGAVRWVSQADIPGALSADESALGLLPLEAVDYHVRSLALDGLDPVRGSGPLDAYPLANRLWLTIDRDAVEDSTPALETAVESLVNILNLHFQSQAAPRPIRLLATGDIIPARCVYAQQLAYQDFRHAFLATADVLRAADITVGSLDASLSDAGEPIGCVPTFSLLAPARSIEGLTYAGFDVMTVASNHAKDCGASVCGDQALLDTLANLEAAGIAPVGGGRKLAEARSGRVLTVDGIRFAFLGYDEVATSDYGATDTTPGTAPLAFGLVAEDVARLRAEADVVIVLNHWGTEYTSIPTERQRRLAREAVNAGATLVIGNHPHAVQAVEFPEGGFVAYALGNFVFDQDWSLETQQGVVMEAVFHGARLVSVRFLPIHIYDMHQPRWADAQEGESILGRMEAASKGLAPFP
jgi:poly-gamma-glutamate capsule biosynthesis protein CapA/YwtB (metallophosphatase superfamily)